MLRKFLKYVLGFVLIFIINLAVATDESNKDLNVNQLAPVVGSSDHRFLQMEKDLPGFGGMFLDENGELNVYMLNPELMQPEVKTYLDHPQSIIESMTADQPIWTINVLQGQFSFSELANWRHLLLPNLAFDGMVFVDVDEKRNRLVIGVSDSSTVRLVEDEVIALDIPRDAVIIEVTEPIRNLQGAATLEEYVRPLIGGLQIVGKQELGVLDEACTLGFNAILNGVSGFVTASHCTEKEAELDSGIFYQPQDPLPPWDQKYRIGRESIDPPFGGTLLCPDDMVCRNSDSAFITYNDGIAADLGAIARPDGIGSLVIDSANPLFEIIGEDCPQIAGTIVDKVGRTTGWTSGSLDTTCAHFFWPDRDDVRMLGCQNGVVSTDDSVIAEGGDSGSPAFINHGDGTVTLVGLLWGAGRSENGNVPYFTYSCMQSIRTDLGSHMITYEPPADVPMVVGVDFPDAIIANDVPVTGTVTFTDSNAGINWAQFDVLQDTCNGCFQPFGFDPGVGNLTEGEFEFNMWCDGDYSWTMELTLTDVQGYVSKPYTFEVICKT